MADDPGAGGLGQVVAQLPDERRGDGEAVLLLAGRARAVGERFEAAVPLGQLARRDVRDELIDDRFAEHGHPIGRALRRLGPSGQLLEEFIGRGRLGRLAGGQPKGKGKKTDDRGTPLGARNHWSCTPPA